MTDITQPIRDALAAFEAADSYRDDKEAVCNFHDALTRPSVIALLARLDAAELDAARYREIREGSFDVHGDVYAMVFATDGDFPAYGNNLDGFVDAAMKGKP